jgi:UDP-N-acetylmuramoyl-tripeptide--D-alanyl-D-alanine ligase
MYPMSITERYLFKMIQPISLYQLADVSKGASMGENIEFSSVAIDTRTLNQGDLYIALKGEYFDGHQFIGKAVTKGCCGFVINNDADYIDEELEMTPYVTVDNTLKVLGDCSRINRENFQGKVIGLTGSSGKTSTKNMLESILTEVGSTCATQGNFNNEVGVPLTLLSINEKHKFAVVEMGARKKGDIKYLNDFVQPDVAILLNAGTAHIDIFGSQEAIVLTKGEIFSSLKIGGRAVVNIDDPAHQIWLDSLEGKDILTFSMDIKTANIYASNIESNDISTNFILNFMGNSQQVFLPVPGLHNVANSLAAFAAAIHLGFDLATIANGLSKLNASNGRLMTIPCSELLVVIDDSYNANPNSMCAAIDVLSLKQGFKIAVLGEMAELGDFSKKLHVELANYVAHSNVDKVYLIGTFSVEMAEIIGERAQAARTKSEVFESLKNKEEIFKTDVNRLVATSILIKGSRSTKMDELVEMIVKEATH